MSAATCVNSECYPSAASDPKPRIMIDQAPSVHPQPNAPSKRSLRDRGKLVQPDRFKFEEGHKVEDDYKSDDYDDDDSSGEETERALLKMGIHR